MCERTSQNPISNIQNLPYMKRRDFLKKAALTTAGTIGVPYILPTGRLFANTGTRVANHVVFVLFAGGIRNQESVGQQYLANQGMATQGNVMNNMLSGAAPSQNLVYSPWNPLLTTPLSQQGTLFKEVHYKTGPTGHYNGHTVAMTGNYTQTGLNLNINPEFPTIFEYYRKHTNPSKSALNAWWLSEGLGPYPSLNYSRHPAYGAAYGANYLAPNTIFGGAGNQIVNAQLYQPDDVQRIATIKNFLDKNFDQSASSLPGIQNTEAEREQVKQFILNTISQAQAGSLEVPTPNNDYNLLTGDLVNIATSWQVLKTFKPELTVINTFNLDVCHDNFSQYINFLHRADYGVGWLWNKIQSDPILANDTILICMPEHGRNAASNNIQDGNGLTAYDHTDEQPQNYVGNTDNSRRCFSLVVGPASKVNQNQSFGTIGNPAAETIDIVPTIAHILGFKDDIPNYLLPGRALTEAFI